MICHMTIDSYHTILLKKIQTHGGNGRDHERVVTTDRSIRPIFPAPNSIQLIDYISLSLPSYP
jgi:hypothetical protein